MLTLSALPTTVARFPLEYAIARIKGNGTLELNEYTSHYDDYSFWHLSQTNKYGTTDTLHTYYQAQDTYSLSSDKGSLFLSNFVSDEYNLSVSYGKGYKSADVSWATTESQYASANFGNQWLAMSHTEVTAGSLGSYRSKEYNSDSSYNSEFVSDWYARGNNWGSVNVYNWSDKSSYAGENWGPGFWSQTNGTAIEVGQSVSQTINFWGAAITFSTDYIDRFVFDEGAFQNDGAQGAWQSTSHETEVRQRIDTPWFDFETSSISQDAQGYSETQYADGSFESYVWANESNNSWMHQVTAGQDYLLA